MHPKFPNPRRWYPSLVSGCNHWQFPNPKKGYLGVPTGIGLGVAMDEDWLKANPWSDNAYPWRANLGANPSRQDVFWS